MLRAGKLRFLTSWSYSRAARSSSPRRSAYCLTKVAILPERMPKASVQTSTWPSHSAPAPMPMVGITSSLVIWAATSPGTISITTANAPASWTAWASASTRSAASPRPCTRYPPRACSLCGVKPMWAITGMPPWLSREIWGVISTPPSIFTQCASPSFMKRAAVT